MRVMVVGSGGREHALCWALARCPSVDRVLAAPGNPGCAEVGEPVACDANDAASVVDAAERAAADLVVVGPEAPLVAGAADALADVGVRCFGPSAQAARLEGSKAFAKQVMADAGVPTAGHWTGTSLDEARAALDRFAPPYVVKADGLAAGKGVAVCADRAEAERALQRAMVDRAFGEAGRRVVVEEYLDGPEVSIFAVCDGRDCRPMAAAADYKRAHDGDRGPNTGGMGAYSPVPALDAAAVEALTDRLLRPVVRTMAERGTPYVGVLYGGLVLTDAGPRVLEYNCRLGDPEAQALLPRLRADGATDLAGLLAACVDGDLAAAGDPAVDRRACVTVVLASGGYPGEHATGVPITGLRPAAALDDVAVFQAGTRLQGDELVTAGGRVLAVSALGDDLDAARLLAYRAADDIDFDRAQRRDDIAAEPIVRAPGPLTEGGAR